MPICRHNLANLSGIKAAAKIFPGKPQVLPLSSPFPRASMPQRPGSAHSLCSWQRAPCCLVLGLPGRRPKGRMGTLIPFHIRQCIHHPHPCGLVRAELARVCRSTRQRQPPMRRAQVAVFDTAFHQTMPAEAYMYALPWDLYKKFHVRKYGFHGTSYSFLVKQARPGARTWPLAGRAAAPDEAGRGCYALLQDYPRSQWPCLVSQHVRTCCAHDTLDCCIAC